MRRVISLWLPRFATDRLCRSRPGWRDSPFATVAAAHGRLLVAAANPAAEDLGVAPGLPLAAARAVVPDLLTVPAEPDADAAALAALAAWCGRYSPWTAPEPASLAGPLGGGAGAWLEATGCAHLFGGEAALLDDLAGRLRRLGYAARAAIADTPGAAWAAARYGADDALLVAPGGARAALAALPVAALRLPPATVASLEGLGLRRIGALYDIPRAALAARCGAAVAARLDAALGAVHEPISPAPPPAVHVERLAFAEPIGRTEDVAAGLDRLLAGLCAGLEAAQAGARELVLWLYRPDGGVERLAVGTSRPNRAPAHLARLFAERLDGLDLGFGFEAMRLDAAVAEPLGPVQPRLDGNGLDGGRRGGADGAVTEALDALVDRLSNRLGADRVRRLRPRQSHLPERAMETAPALRAAPAAAGAAWAPPGAPPRPLRLLPRPEPIEAVAPVPDDPPVMFRWRRVVHRVVRAEGPERIAPEWWRGGAPDDGALRDYYRVEDTAGGRYWLYRQGLYRDDAPPPSWFLHGVFG